MTSSRLDPHAEDGTMLIWMLCVVIMTMFLGGVALDLWRAFSERRAVAGIVDAAAIAGASGIDEDAYRFGNVVRLDEADAERRAFENLQRHSESVTDPVVEVAPDGSTITVTASRDVPFTLMRILLPELDTARVEASAVSAPVLGAP